METVSLKMHLKMFWSFIVMILVLSLLFSITIWVFIATYNSMQKRISQRDEIIAKYYFTSDYDYGEIINTNTNNNTIGGE